MARKAIPPWGWHDTHNAADMDRRVARLDFNWLNLQLNTAGGDDPVDLELQILSALWTFYRQQFDVQAPLNVEVLATFEKLLRSVSELSQDLQRLDERSRRLMSLGFQALNDRSEHDYPKGALERTARLFLAHLSKNSQAEFVTTAQILSHALSVLDLPVEKTARGPKPKMAIKGLIDDIAQLIQDYCRHDPLEGFYYDPIEELYRGKLVQILEHIFERFAPDLNMSNSAIGGQIRRRLRASNI